MASRKKKKFQCLKCEKETVTKNNFYKNNNPLISDSLEVVPICKSCIEEYMNASKNPNDKFIRVIYVLTLLNRPLIADRWESSNKDWKSYIRQVSSLNGLKDLTFEDGDLFSMDKGDITQLSPKPVEAKGKEVVEFSDEEMNYLIDFWGRGFTHQEYEYLQNEYEKLINSYECDSYSMEMLFQEVSHTRLSIKKKRENHENVDKDLKALQELMTSANIKPVQETGANATEQASFGTLIKKFENEKPIPEPDDAWKDVDGIQKYVKVWFFGHLCKMLGIKNEYSDEYEKELARYTVESPDEEEDEGSDSS